MSKLYKTPTPREYLERELKHIQENLHDGDWAYHGSPPVSKLALEFIFKDILSHLIKEEIINE